MSYYLLSPPGLAWYLVQKHGGEGSEAQYVLYEWTGG